MTLRLRLYIAGESPNSLAAVLHLRQALAGCPAEGVELEIIDVLTDPQRGLRDCILVTPMLVRIAPVPERRVLGSLTDRPGLLGLLGLTAAHTRVSP
jgi:circadian clock protein KaiB